MKRNRIIVYALLCLASTGMVNSIKAQQPLTLQQLLEAMGNNYELLKSQGSLVQSKQAAAKATKFDRLPHLNMMAQATVSSDNNLEGAYQSYGMIPSLVSGDRAQSNLSAISGDAALAGINWEAVNFGEYKARNDLAKTDLLVQTNTLASTQYDLNGYASAYYLELLRQYRAANSAAGQCFAPAAAKNHH